MHVKVTQTTLQDYKKFRLHGSKNRNKSLKWDLTQTESYCWWCVKSPLLPLPLITMSVRNQQVRFDQITQHFAHMHMCGLCKNLIFSELPPQTADILICLRDLGLQTLGVTHLWILLVHAPHLVQSLAEIKQTVRCVILEDISVSMRKASFDSGLTRRNDAFRGHNGWLYCITTVVYL